MVNQPTIPKRRFMVMSDSVGRQGANGELMIAAGLVTNGLECLAAFREESFEDGRMEDIVLQQRVVGRAKSVRQTNGMN